MADWAELLQDVLFEIAKKLTAIEDFVAFRAVCTSWRSAATKKDYVNDSPQIPWLMLADKKYTHMREFYSLTRDKIYRFPLPEVKAKRFYTSQGWIITIGKDWNMNMVHPLTRAQINLPHMKTFEDIEELGMPHMYADFIWKVVLSSSPSYTSNYAVMVMHGWCRKLAFWRPGDGVWTTIKTTRRNLYCDVVYYKHQFYALDNKGRIFVFDVEGPNPTKAVIVSEMPERLIRFIEKLYLVESCGKLLVVSREGQQRREDEPSLVRSNFTTKFQVFEVNLSNTDEWTEVKSLGNSALFLGHNSSFSVDVTNNPGCKNDCIYFTDDFFEAYRGSSEGGGRDMGIYHIHDGSIEPHYMGESFSPISPPLWIEPSF